MPPGRPHMPLSAHIAVSMDQVSHPGTTPSATITCTGLRAPAPESVAITDINGESAVTTAVAFVDALAWPLTVLLLSYLLRRELRAIARAIEGRIKSESTDISIGPAGLGITTRVEAITARMESLEVGQAQYGDLILQQLEVPTDANTLAAILCRPNTRLNG
jgi:hypothetical protein